MDASTSRPLSPLAQLLVDSFEHHETPGHGRKISVNPVVAKVASWYEKLRNAMEYREEEVMLRAATERILRRLLLLGGNAKTTAEPLVRELVWARYLENNSVTDSTVEAVEKEIDLHLRLRILVMQRHKIPEGELNELTYQMMSSSIAHVIHPNHEKEVIANFMFQVLRDDVEIFDEEQETRDAQVYMAVRRAFARDDVAFLRYHLLKLYFGELKEETLDEVVGSFMQGYQELLKQLKYPRKDRIYNYIRKRTAAFFILEDVMRSHRGKLKEALENEQALEKAVYNSCDEKYHTTGAKVQRAVIRSVLFILLTKVVFAFAIEGTYERVVYGHILWPVLAVNTLVPPLLMLVVSFFLRPPGTENSMRILTAIKTLLYTESPRLGDMLRIKKQPDKPSFLFNTLWLLAFVISFGGIVYALRQISFNYVSIGVFLFFLTIVSFLAYRISLASNLYRMGEKQGVVTPFVDFFFMPVIRVGQRLTLNISKINILLFVFDFLIETPFKAIFAFSEQWFHFLHSKRDELG